MKKEENQWCKAEIEMKKLFCIRQLVYFLPPFFIFKLHFCTKLLDL